MVILENEALRISTVPGKGSDIIEINYKPLDLDFSWVAPGGLRPPVPVPIDTQDPTAHFLDTYPGGWQEIFPSGGAPSDFAGARFGQHGETYALPWDVRVEKDDEHAIAVSFDVRTRKTPFRIRKTINLRAGEASFSIHETLTNKSDIRLPVMWGHHIVFGKPFLRPGVEITLPPDVKCIPHSTAIAPDGRRRVKGETFTWPQTQNPGGDPLDLGIIPPPAAPSDIVYLTDFPDPRAWYEISDPGRGVGCRVEWDRSVMPYLWYWQEFGAHTSYPWYGRVYVAGLEPFSSMPTNGLAEAVSNGTALIVDGHQSIDFDLSFSILTDRRSDRSTTK